MQSMSDDSIVVTDARIISQAKHFLSENIETIISVSNTSTRL